MLGYKKSLESGLKLLDKDEIISKYYIRLEVNDESGVLASIASLLGKFDISIESMLQKPSLNKTKANVLFTTHTCKEKDIQNAITQLAKLNGVDENIAMIRIEK
jgi:homoserine dehydrogenase